MPPKPKTKCRRPGSSAFDDLFHYNNQVELTFKNQPKRKALAKLGASEISSSDEEAEIPENFKGKFESNTCTFDSSSSDVEEQEDHVILSDSQGANNSQERVEEETAAFAARPVTPPPMVRYVQTSNFSRQAVKLSRDVDNKLRSLQEVTQQSPSSVTGWSDIIIVDQSTPDPAERKITVRIRTRNGVERFPITMSENFDGIITKLANKQKVPIETISLSFTDRKGNFQALKGTDSPISVNLSCADIIDCIIVSSAPSQESLQNDDNVVNIKIQGSQADSIKLFKALKDEALGNIMKQYAEFRGLPLSKLKFQFDGETISPDQSADDLDMDEDNVVDVQLVS